MENKMNAKELIKGIDWNYNLNESHVIELMETYARQKVLEYARQLTMSEFIHEGPTKSVDHFFEKD